MRYIGNILLAVLPPSPCMTSLEVSRCAWSLWCAGQVFRGDQQGSHKQHVLTSPAQCESIQAEKKRAGGARGHRETEKRDVIPGMPLILLSWWHCSHFVFLLFFFFGVMVKLLCTECLCQAKHTSVCFYPIIVLWGAWWTGFWQAGHKKGTRRYLQCWAQSR